MNGIKDSTTVVEERVETQGGLRIAQFVELTKPRLTILSLLTTLAGYYLGAKGEVDATPLLQTLCATFLVGAGCAAFNMSIEREFDSMMRRTQKRPLPSGQVSPVESFLLGIICTVAGLVWLALAANLLAAVLAGMTFVTYVCFYTPLKRITTLNTIVGAVPGALPPLIGWAAAAGTLSPGALAVFALLFFWQMPHFLALAWMYRKDYARAGFRMLPSVDPTGEATSRQILLYSSALLPVSLIPTLFGVSGYVYFFGAVLLGLMFVGLSLRFASRRDSSSARAVFHFSLLYLPVLLIAMVVDGPTF